MNSKSYADVVSGQSSSEDDSVREPSNTLSRRSQLEDKADALKRAIENSKVHE